MSTQDKHQNIEFPLLLPAVALSLTNSIGYITAQLDTIYSVYTIIKHLHMRKYVLFHIFHIRYAVAYAQMYIIYYIVHYM